jgi:hypothetical protein
MMTQVMEAGKGIVEPLMKSKEDSFVGAVKHTDLKDHLISTKK